MPLKKSKFKIKKIDQIVKIIEKKKGKNIEIFNISEASSITDYFIISTALSRIHLKTLRDEIMKKNNEEKILGIDGKPESGWVVLDYGDYIIHLMSEEERNYYTLEEMWNGAAKTVYYA
jgi:ribosome-associated protein